VPFSLEGIPIVNTFVARDEEMLHIKKTLLSKTQQRMRRKVFVLHGLGGIGKTQLSVEFARQHHHQYSAVFWLDGSSKDRLRQSMANIASRLPQNQVLEVSKEYARNKDIDIDAVIEDVLRWLSLPSNERWLLIFDNVDHDYFNETRDPQAYNVQTYFPSADQGSILITTRLASLRRYGTDLKLITVNYMQGKAILENNIGRSVEGG
jgi:hypothetical protein